MARRLARRDTPALPILLIPARRLTIPRLSLNRSGPRRASAIAQLKIACISSELSISLAAAKVASPLQMSSFLVVQRPLNA
jgi:hypothetical protein